MWAPPKLSPQPNCKHLHRTVALSENRIYAAPMTQLRCTLFALLGLSLAACGDDPTVVSVNISLDSAVRATENLKSVHVLITQDGQTIDETIDAPYVPSTVKETLPDGGMGTADVEIMIPDDGYFQRFELSGFKGGEARLKVELQDSSKKTLLNPDGEPLVVDTAFTVRENGAVAAYAEFEYVPPAEETTSEPASSGDTGSGDTSATSAASSAPASDTSSAPATSGAATSSETAAPADAGVDASAADAG